MSETPSLPGRFVWCDLMTSDVAASKRFYGALFPGWQHAPQDAEPPALGYERISLAGRGIGGVVTIDPAHGTASQWVPYATVKDVEASVERARQLGGKVYLGARDIPKTGRFALIADPQGAMISPISLLEEPPEHSGPMPDGAFCWHELMTTDVVSATAFYGDLFGWSHAEVPMGASPYHLFRRGAADAAGMIARPSGVEAPPMWTVYIYANDFDASLAKVQELGGKVHMPPQQMPGVGRFAIVADPLGAVFALFRSER